MPSLRVPPGFRQPMADIAGLEDDVASSLVEVLRALPPYAPVTEIQRVVQQTVGDSTDSSPDAIAAALLSLRGQFRQLSGEDLAELVSESEELNVGDARPLLKDRLGDLLSTDVLNTTGVAVDLQTQHQRNFQSARIFTDIRPVFQHDLQDGPSGAVIVETLQLLTWNRTAGGEELYIAMDEDDLLELQRVVERAVAKTDALRAFLNEKGLPYFELERGES
jgi:hypothetical protein